MKRTKKQLDSAQAPQKKKFNSLNELFNYSRKKESQIKEKTLAEYKAEIEKMNLADLQSHAINLSLKPSRNRAMLEKALINNYSKQKAELVPVVEETNKVKNLDRVLKILSKGA